MLLQRTIVALLLLPVGIFAIMLGGLPLLILVLIILLLATSEYLHLFSAVRSKFARNYLLLLTALLLTVRWMEGFSRDPILIPLLIFGLMLYYLLRFERGDDEAGSAFAISLSGMLYVGYLGGFVFVLRDLELGQWWLLIAVASTWMADMGAYFIGKSVGRHKMAPRLSPNKSWEGYLGGALFSILLMPFYVQLLSRYGMPASPLFSVDNIRIMALVLSTLPPLGDFGISMIKRQFHTKHTGDILPGHGGMLDRMDSIFWALPMAYILITSLFQ